MTLALDVSGWFRVTTGTVCYSGRSQPSSVEARAATVHARLAWCRDASGKGDTIDVSAGAGDQSQDRACAAHIRSLYAERAEWMRAQPEWERLWGAPDPGGLRDTVTGILNAHGVLDPDAAAEFSEPDDLESNWAMAVLAGSIRVARSARFTLDFGHGLPNGDWPARLVTQFAAATGGDWQPRGLRCAGPGRGRYRGAIIDFTSGGHRQRWQLPQAGADDLLTVVLDHVVAFASEQLPGRFLLRWHGLRVSVVYAPASPVDEVRAALRGWPSPTQLMAMVRASSGPASPWPDSPAGNRVRTACQRLGLESPRYDIPDPDGSLPLHEAARLGRTRIVAELLRDGADPLARDGAGRQAIDQATEPAIRQMLASRSEGEHSAD